MRTVLTIGTFDVFHFGHVELLRRCQEIAGDGWVAVGVNSDEFVERFKGHPPVMNQRHRMAILRACRYVNVVCDNMGDEDGSKVIEWIKPAALIIGSDWAPPRDYHKQLGITPEWLAERDIELIFLPRTEGVSSSELREKMGAAGRRD